jgi:protein-arginine kinase activator protein McsA
MNLDQKVKCPECYFIFKNDSSRKYINCPECKAELNQKDLTIVTDENNQAAQKSIFAKAIDEINKNGASKLIIFLSLSLVLFA